jgi:nucleoside-diphosphate-sugar epimerase
MQSVLVTGGSGFIAVHCILQLLSKGYRVRASVRDLTRERTLRAMLQQAGCEAGDQLAVVSADLTADAGWSEAVRGCDYVLHVASPFPGKAVRDENELIVPAREGTLRVLRASRDAGVRRVVLTSSFAAVGYGHPARAAPFDESVWTDLSGDEVAPYPKSKTLAERAAWDFIAREGAALELSVVNPVAVFGPVLGPDYSTSILLLKGMLEGTVPALPTAGESLSLRQIALLLRSHLGERAVRVPTREIPDGLLRLVGLVVPMVKQVLPELGKIKHASSDKARRLLAWNPRSSEQSIVATAESLMQRGLVRR